MQRGIGIGRWLGIDVRVDWSWLVALALFFTSLATHYVAVHPTWSVALSLGLSVLATIGLALSMLAHEAVHALVARRLGMPVTGVTMHLLGGVSTFDRASRPPGREVIAAVAGPITSFSIGMILLVIAGTFAMPAAKLWVDPAAVMAVLGPISSLVVWLAIANLAIAAFNALPAFPLDGGRIVRAVLWETSGDHHGSTRIAARLGQGVALGLVAVGIAAAFRLGPTSVAAGIWMMFLGWFLLSSTSEYHHGALIEERLSGLQARHLMRAATTATVPDATLAEAVAKGFGATTADTLPVMDAGSCIGVLRFDDLRKVASSEWATRKVGEVMTGHDRIPEVKPWSDLSSVLRAMAQAELTSVAVREGDDVVGVVEMADLVRWLEVADPQPLPKIA